MKKLLLIVNAHSGRGEIRHRALDVIDIFTAAGFVVTFVPTQYAGHATEIARAYGGEYDRVVCCGGDGTVNETLNGLMTHFYRPQLGILPAGTMNDYAYSLAIPSSIVRAASVAAEGHPFSIDVGNFNGRYFTYVAAFGLFTDVTYETDQDAKNILGIVAYLLEGVKRVSSIKTYRVRLEYDDGVLEETCIVGLFSNSISIAGMRTAYRDALLDDGKVEICLIRPPKTLAAVQDFVNILLNIKQVSELEHSEFLRVVHTKKAVLTCEEPIAWTVDGESGGTFTTASIKACQQAITVIAGRDMAHNSTLPQPEESDA